MVPSTEGGARALWRGTCRASLVTASAQPIHLSKAQTPHPIWTPQPLISCSPLWPGAGGPWADLCQQSLQTWGCPWHSETPSRGMPLPPDYSPNSSNTKLALSAWEGAVGQTLRSPLPLGA